MGQMCSKRSDPVRVGTFRSRLYEQQLEGEYIQKQAKDYKEWQQEGPEEATGFSQLKAFRQLQASGAEDLEEVPYPWSIVPEPSIRGRYTLAPARLKKRIEEYQARGILFYN